MTPIRPPAPIVVVALLALAHGVTGLALTLDVLIVARGGEPLLAATPTRGLMSEEDGTAAAMVAVGLGLLQGVACVVAAVGLLRSRSWARVLMRAVALVMLALAFGVFLVRLWMYLKWKDAEMAAPLPDIDSLALWLLVVAVLGRGTARSRSRDESPASAAEPSLA